MLRYALVALWLCVFGAPAAAAPWYVARYRVSVHDKPGPALEVAAVTLGTSIEVVASQRGWRQVKLTDGKMGWVRRGSLSQKPLSQKWLCRRGRVYVDRGNMAPAIAHLQLAMDRGTKRRRCLVSLRDLYLARGQQAEAGRVRARLRELEDWLPGVWCDARQTMRLTFDSKGSFSFRAGGKLIGSGQFYLRRDELRLADSKDRGRDLLLLIRKRGFGHALAAPNADEFTRQFCP